MTCLVNLKELKGNDEKRTQKTVDNDKFFIVCYKNLWELV